MQKMRGGQADAPRGHRLFRKLAMHLRWKKRDRWHWFDHPEMQARIAEAEADLREGRYQSGTTAEEMQRQLDALKK